MIYINRFIDNEEDTTRYEQFILTNENCCELINECIETYYELHDYENVGEYLKECENVDERIINAINKDFYQDYDYCDLENAYNFTMIVLEHNDLLTEEDYETLCYYY